MGSKTRLSSYCTKRANNGVNLVTSRKINTRLARPIESILSYSLIDLAFIGMANAIVLNSIVTFVSHRYISNIFWN